VQHLHKSPRATGFGPGVFEMPKFLKGEEKLRRAKWISGEMQNECNICQR